MDALVSCFMMEKSVERGRTELVKVKREGPALPPAGALGDPWCHDVAGLGPTGVALFQLEGPTIPSGRGELPVRE